MTIHSIETPRGTMHVRDEGTGSPILFVHGFPLDGRMWDAQVEHFAKGHRVLVPDLIGFGQSATPPTDAISGMEFFAEELNLMLDQLLIDTPVVFCGLSMGGYIAWRFWKRFPERISQLVLCDTKAVADTDEVRETREKTAKLVLERGNEPLAEMMSSKLFAPKTSQDVLDRVKTLILAASPEGIAAASRGMAGRPDVRDWLPEINCPSLCIVGEEDTISTPEEMQQIAGAIPDCKCEVIPGAGHMSPMEQPERFNETLGRLLNS